VRDADIAALRQAAADAAAARSIGPAQIILFGTGEAGRLAVDLVLRGAMAATGVIGLDISLAEPPSAVLPTAAMVRLVQHGADDPARAARFRGLVEALRRQHLDVRSMLLPDAATPSMTMRAGAVFLVELVAKASRVTAELGG
jgi:predicted esterase